MKGIWDEVFKRLSFRVDYKKPDELKTAILYFFAVFVFLRLLAVGLNQTEFFSLVLTIGALVYLMATLYFVHKLFQPKFKDNLKLYHYVWAMVYAMILLWVLYLMFAPITIASENTAVSLIISLLLILLPASFSDEIIDSLKKKFYPILLMLPAMPNLSDINVTQVQNLVSGKLPDLTSPFPYFDVLESLISKYGIALIVIVIVVALLSLRVIKTILQLLLVVVIMWAVAKFLGFL